MPALVEMVVGVLQDLALHPKYLDLELTESNVFQNEAITIVNKFSEIGIPISIDDFGTGYSDFCSLKLIHVSTIKIDKTFIQDIDVSIDSKNIVLNTLALAKSMNILCVAEGVESLEQVKILKQNGCNLMQGYYFSKPLSEVQFLEYIENHAHH